MQHEESKYPLCAARRCLVDTPNGPMVNLGAIHASFTRAERAAWFSATFRSAVNEYGMPPQDVEDFLSTLGT